MRRTLALGLSLTLAIPAGAGAATEQEWNQRTRQAIGNWVRWSWGPNVYPGAGGSGYTVVELAVECHRLETWRERDCTARYGIKIVGTNPNGAIAYRMVDRFPRLRLVRARSGYRFAGKPPRMTMAAPVPHMRPWSVVGYVVEFPKTADGQHPAFEPQP